MQVAERDHLIRSMRVLLLLTFLSASYLSIGQRAGNFRLKGTIDNKYTGKVFLNYTIADSISVEDSTEAREGNFMFRGLISEPVEGMLHLGRGTAAGWIYLDTGMITLLSRRFTTEHNGKSITGLAITAVNGSFSDSIKKEFSLSWQELNQSDKPDSIKANLLYLEMAAFVKKYPAHNLSSSFLSEAAMLGYLNYAQASAIFDLLDKKQKDKASLSGVEQSLKMLNKTATGMTYSFIAQPDSTGNLISGRELTYDYLLIDFWASWCLPCRAGHPALIASYNRYRNRKFEILSISLDENRTQWIEAIQKDKLPWTQLSDLKGMTANALAKYYSIAYLPFNILIDKQGKIIDSNIKVADLPGRLALLFGK
jgi:thiol-disulfide isomerase/thioredoxin